MFLNISGPDHRDLLPATKFFPLILFTINVLKSNAQLQTRGSFTLILGQELFSLLKILLCLWNVGRQ
jgi:hypothetical protein